MGGIRTPVLTSAFAAFLSIRLSDVTPLFSRSHAAIELKILAKKQACICYPWMLCGYGPATGDRRSSVLLLGLSIRGFKIERVESAVRILRCRFHPQEHQSHGKA
jgi:hypothetical protein